MGGVVSARNKGLAISNGDYVSFIDGDDYVDTNYVENMIACLHGCRDVDIGVTLSYYIEYADGVSSYVCADILQGIESRLYDKQGIYDIVWKDYRNTLKEQPYPQTLWAKIFKHDFARKVLGNVDEAITNGEDCVGNFLLLLNASSIGFSLKSGYHYVMHADSTTGRVYDIDRIGVTSAKTAWNNVRSYIYSHIENDIERDFYLNKWARTIWFMLMCATESFFNGYSQTFLFPYPDISNGARIIVYAMSVYGRHLSDFLLKSDRFCLVGVSDRRITNTGINRQLLNGYEVMGYTTGDLAEVAYEDYDYIIVAATTTSQTIEIESFLHSIGISMSKIANMDENLLRHSPFDEV